MADAPRYMPFYWEDFFGDEKVMAMSTLAIGAYWKLMRAAWVASPPCSIPDDDKQLARIAMVTDEQWAEIKEEVLAPWKRKREKRYHGRLVQTRLLKEFRNIRRLIARNRTNGSKGGRKRAVNAGSKGDDVSSAGLALGNPDPSLPDQTKPNRNQNQILVGNCGYPPTPREQSELRAYALEVVGLPRDWLVAVTDLLPDFSVSVAVGGLEHLASRRTTSRAKTFREIKKPAAFLKDLLVKVESGERPEDQGNAYEPFENWRARKAAELENVKA